MGLLDYFSPSRVALNVQEPTQSADIPVNVQITPLMSPKNVPLPLSPDTSPSEIAFEDKPSKQAARRFSFRPFSVQLHVEHKDALSAIQEHEKKEQAAAALSKRLAKSISSSSDKRAKQSALLVRGLIVGPTASSPKLSSAVAKPQMSKLKSQLMQPKSANKIIAHLRELSAETGDSKPTGPIHAVCLAHPDDKEHELHFSKLGTTLSSVSSFEVMNSAPVDALSSLFNEMHVIDLVKSPDFGLGQPGDGDGVLAGALPTAETVINGIEQVTPQLMALGYATGRAIIPDHAGIHPPIDRMSVLTYWWGLEVVLPPPSLVYLANAHSISGSVVNFLSAAALINNGVREILPFVRYISQFIDFEFKSIQSQDRGKGVVCAATWIMPAAMVPRPWDFTPPESNIISKPTAPTEGNAEPSVSTNPSTPDGSSPVSPPAVSLPTESSAPQAAPIALTPSIPATSANPPAPLITPLEGASIVQPSISAA
ncbi:hypothetical protein J3R30DRAFT_3698256 [Lentinula aciculospora]|uniref:Uncharacterized protein n=1 Tax=Lentinula aciculospora TaxID=153920 RepID=A0A9W9DSG8_9AGAR|nr:hypothetical protein J3R30DRAFT_3698256 [Lentinula aciculospora]